MKPSYSDTLTLDRIDPNGDYTVENCQWVTKTSQARNKGMSGKNKTGVTGVHKWVDSKNGTEYYVAAAVSICGKIISKYFSIKKYGDSAAFQMACEHRRSLIDSLNESGAGYGEKHGQNKEVI